ncbi:MAG: DNA repair and recombination protein RadB [Candidatus Saliniplasma sp.]
MQISTGCETIDDLLDGGIESGTITELFGGGGTGKTNLSLQIAKNVASEGKKVAFLDTEGVSIERLKQISSDEYEKVMNNTLIFRACSFQEQEDKLENIVNMALRDDMDVGLVVVDSMTVFYRTLLNDGEHQKTSTRLGRMLIKLMKVAREKDIPVLVTTQVYGGDDTTKPLGGHILYHNAKTILKLEEFGPHIRKCTVMKHRSMAERRSIKFKITNQGVVSV